MDSFLLVGERPLGGSLRNRQDVEGFAPFLLEERIKNNNMNKSKFFKLSHFCVKHVLTFFVFLCCMQSFAVIKTGKCGANINYSYDTSTCILEIKGTGKMDDYSKYNEGVFYKDHEIHTYVKEINVSEGVTHIGDYAFAGMGTYYNFTISLPQSLQTIGNYSFYLSKLEKTIIPQNVVSVGVQCFGSCKILEEVIISDGVRSISDWAFSGCKTLQSVRIPNSVVSIGEYAFNDCESLSTIVLPTSIETIKRATFFDCKTLQTIEIPHSVKRIENSAFRGCTNLNEITIPTNVKIIEAVAFPDELKSLIIEDSPEDIEIESSLFIDSLKRFHYGRNIIIEDDHYGFHIGSNMLSIVEISPYVRTLPNGAFSNSAIESIFLPSSIKEIHAYAFFNCKSICRVEIENFETLCNIKFENSGSSPFSYSPNADLVVDGKETTLAKIQEGVEHIGQYAFYNAKTITGISLPSTLKSIGNHAFCYNENVKFCVSKASNPPSFGDYAFLTMGAPFWVPTSCLETYKNDKDWAATHNKFLPLPDGVDIPILIEEIVLPSEIAIYTSDTIPLFPNIIPENATIQELDIEVDNIGVGKYEGGKFIAKHPGVTKVTFTTKDETKIRVSANIIISAVLAQSLKLSDSELTMTHHENRVLGVEFYPTNTYNQTVQWCSLDESVVAIDDKGTILAKNPGTTKVFAITKDGSELSDTCSVTVLPILATDINLQNERYDIGIGEVLSRIATVFPTDASNSTLAYTTSAPEIVEIDEHNNMRALKKGICTITVNTTDGTDICKNIEIVVHELETVLNIEKDDEQLLLNWYTLYNPSPISYYNVYVAEDNDPFILWIPNTLKTSSVFMPQKDKHYRFLVTACDKSNNMEKYDERQAKNYK